MCTSLTGFATRAYRSALLCLLLALAHGAPRAQDGQSPESNPKVPDSNHDQEVIVWLKDDQPFAELQGKLQNFKTQADKDRAGAAYRTQVKRLTESFLARAMPQSAAVVKSYANLPVALIKVTDQELLDRLGSAPEVQGIYPNQKHKLFLTESLPLINQHLAADLGAKGKNTAVAILDTGVNYTHPEFGSCASPGVPATCRVVYADDFTSTDDGHLDADGHGTNVAGIAAGVAPETKIIALDVFTGEYANTSDILSAIDWVIQHQAGYNIVAVNLSLGVSQLNVTQCTNSVFSGAFQRLRQAGAIPVVASGNDAYINGLAEPACAPGAVSVGAVYDAPFNYIGWQECTDYSAAEGQVTCFSNSAGYLNLLAPGSRITAAGLTMSGTSMAAPHVAGAVAVLRGDGGYPGATVDEIVSHLVTSGRPVKDSRNNLTHPLIDLEAALYVGKPLSPPVIMSVTPDSAGKGTTVMIEGSGFIRVTGVSFGGTPAASFRVRSTRKIVAVVGEGASGEVSVTTIQGTATMPGFVYLPPLMGINNIPASHQLTSIDDQLQLRVEGTYADGTTRDVTQAATFYTANSNVATVDARGLVRPVDEGVTTIQSNMNGFSAATSLEVNFIANKVFETEPNNAIENANSVVEDGKIHVGRLSDTTDVDMYEIDLPNPRLISVLIRIGNTSYGEILASILD
ncbi:MAG TPA: S8 family serine peptidase, partial [Gammaproteobacteria bacterium]|nr:S8 family serine peptidase [Gammaproteobacteria bacterium]